MNDVSANFNAEVTTDAAGSLDNLSSLPAHGAEWTRGHVLNKTWVERLVSQVLVVLLHVILRSLHEFHAAHLEALLFKTLDDLTDEATLDTIGFDSDEGAFSRHVVSCA